MSSNPSPIEKQFRNAARDVIDGLEQEKSIGRYRVDFVVEEYNLIIELDGHKHHKSREDRTRDARRQRYLQKIGYTVFRFTGSEIYRDVDLCVREVRDFIRFQEGLDPSNWPGLILIDWLFLTKWAAEAIRRYGDRAERSVVSFSAFLDGMVEYMGVEGNYQVLIQMKEADESVIDIDVPIFSEYRYGEFLIDESVVEWVAMTTLDLISRHAHRHSEVILVADGKEYYSGLRARGQSVDKILRSGEEDSSLALMSGAEWQDVLYPLAHGLGIEYHQL